MSLFTISTGTQRSFHMRIRPLHWLWRMMCAAANASVEFFEHRSAAASLARLSDRELRDVGLARSNIGEAVRGRFDPRVF